MGVIMLYEPRDIRRQACMFHTVIVRPGRDPRAARGCSHVDVRDLHCGTVAEEK